MKQFFPFGRGERGSRQRLVVQLGKWGGSMVVHSLQVKVLKTFAPDVMVFQLGFSSGLFFTSQFSELWKATQQAIKDFPTVQHNNQVIKGLL